VDGRSIRLKNGQGATLVAAGERHALSWVVRGAPGSTYFIEITAPPEAKLRHSDTFDDDALDAGVVFFSVNDEDSQ
jgi:hypothetical protein